MLRRRRNHRTVVVLEIDPVKAARFNCKTRLERTIGLAVHRKNRFFINDKPAAEGLGGWYGTDPHLSTTQYRDVAPVFNSARWKFGIRGEVILEFEALDEGYVDDLNRIDR